jgi:hypothetical protein
MGRGLFNGCNPDVEVRLLLRHSDLDTTISTSPSFGDVVGYGISFPIAFSKLARAPSKEALILHGSSSIASAAICLKPSLNSLDNISIRFALKDQP